MKNILYYLEFIGLRLLVVLVGILPNSIIPNIQSFLASFLEKRIGYRAKVIHKNLRNSFPYKTERELYLLAHAYYQHLSNLVIETLRAFRVSKNKLLELIQYDNPQILVPHLSKKKPLLLLGSHFGNWELGCLSFPLQLSYPVYTVYKPIKNPYINRYIQAKRSRWGMNMISMNQLGRSLITNRNQAAVYILLMDQSPASIKHAIWKDFLNQATPFLHGAEKIVQKTNYPVFYFDIKKTKKGNHTVHFIELNNGEQHIEYGDITTSFAKELSKQIMQNPSQWLWSHNRWKRKKPHS